MKNIAVAAVLLTASFTASAESACNAETMDAETLATCIVVEGDGSSWEEYLQEMKRLEAEILSDNTKPVKAAKAPAPAADHK